MRPHAAIVVVALALLMPVAASAQTDLEGAKDHPLVPRIPGGQYHVGAFDQQDFSNHTFSTPDGDKELEGRFLRIEYWLNDNGKKLSPLEILRNYKNAFLQKKGQVVYEHADAVGGRATLRLPLEGRSLWMDLVISNNGEAYALHFIEEAAMKQSLELTSGAMAAALEAAGTVTLRGILFETAKADIKAESAPLLAEVATLLNDDRALRLEIQGHTDNTGTGAANMTLSRQRADAVKSWLVSKHGIAAARLTTAGFGDTKPVADNKTEDGRAKNRRVELVKK